MKFNRVALLTAVAEALVNDQLIWEAREAEALAKHEQARTAWLEQHGDAWAASARKVLRSIKAGKPVTMDMLPRDRWRSGICVFDQAERVPPTYHPPADLRRLQVVLMACADETITSAALRDFGLTGDTLRTAAKYLARESVVS